MELVDTHCHVQSIGQTGGERHTSELWAKAENVSVDSVLSNALSATVNTLIVVGCDLEDSKLAVTFVSEHDGTWASIGIHPHEAKDFVGNTEMLDEFADLTTLNKVVAVGECGLDYYYTHSPKEDQEKILIFQIELALKHNLPIIFHVRDAFDDFWPIFDRYSNIHGVIHSFTDTKDNLDKALERGLYVGVNGIATFTKDPAQKEMYASIPLDRLLLETDAPFLAPHPHRGTTNEPKNIQLIASYLSEQRGITLEVLADQTTANAKMLFSIERKPDYA